MCADEKLAYSPRKLATHVAIYGLLSPPHYPDYQIESHSSFFDQFVVKALLSISICQATILGKPRQNLRDFYHELLQWEGKKFRPLVHEWPPDLRETVRDAFATASKAASLHSSVCQLNEKSTNQSAGNQVEKHCIRKLSGVMEGFTIYDCTGRGYPDKTLDQKGTNLRITLEVKATSDWNENDTNRRVLTSSSKKLRQNFASPIHHLLLTVLYARDRDFATIGRIRLDFLEPTTPVNVRLEASVSHKILAKSEHYAIIL